MFHRTRQVDVGVAMFVIAAALAIFTSDALAFHWQVVAWTSGCSAAVWLLVRRFPRAVFLPGILGPICIWIDSSYYGPAGSLTFYQNIHAILVFIAVFAGVTVLMESLWPRPSGRGASERSAR